MAKDNKPEVIPAGNNPHGKETLAVEPKEKIAAIYDGTIEAAVMLHKLAKEDLSVIVLQSANAKFTDVKRDPNFKGEIPAFTSSEIEGIGAQDKGKILDYIQDCGDFCKDNKIRKLYIPWKHENIAKTNEQWQDLYMNAVPVALNMLSTFDEKTKEEKDYVRPVFYWQTASTEDIEKNKLQYGLI